MADITTALTLLLVFAGSAAVLGLAVHAVVTLIRNDGYYPHHRPVDRIAEPPRSHPADEFEPRSRAA
jgi:hypothetical protein